MKSDALEHTATGVGGTGSSSHLATACSEWLSKGNVQKLVVAVSGQHSNETLERWVFEVQTDHGALGPCGAVDKPEKEVMAEIQAIIRQITASVCGRTIPIPTMHVPSIFTHTSM